MIDVIQATPEHVADAQAWMVARGIPTMPTDAFSSRGFVAPGLAGVWLYTTNSSLTFLEMLVSNPDAPKEARRAALDAVVAAAISAARESGARLMLVQVNRADVEEIALRHDLAPLGIVKALALNLQKEPV